MKAMSLVMGVFLGRLHKSVVAVACRRQYEWKHVQHEPATCSLMHLHSFHRLEKGQHVLP
jgi:hypothetical protein